ncbi:S1C family serine protease [Falsiroseomonas sp.]|uniref:S1C family serine protease n=1 Tax=Falsiroseomonas sp. TaxID=2870721 RepID=UPI00271E4F35|nr:serine protease [Falsiroseomonas sp.]MDO9499222.1 serine protease [Falsiroseomonas sp.]
MPRPSKLIPALLLGLLPGLLASGAAFGQGKPPPSNMPGFSQGFPPLPTSKPPPLPAGPQAGMVPAKPGAPPAAGTGRMVSSGTGFMVAPGRALTNAHVVERCRAVRVRLADGTDATARVLRADRQRDLALIEVPRNAGPALSFRREMNIRRGEGVVTYGFPLAGMLSSGPTLTTGEVSALAGLADDQRQFQISAPVQPGNSGGPLLDLAGHVVGVIVSKLNAARVAQRTGDIPQNVNFAVKGNEAVDFLRDAGITPILADGPPRTAAEVGEIAHPSTLFMRCMG